MITGSNGKYIYRAGANTTDPNSSGTMDQAGDVMIVDVRDLEDVSILVNQVTDAGTATIHVDVSYDGVNFQPDVVAALSEGSFAAGNAVALNAYQASDAHGMPLAIEQIRVRLTAVAGGGVYSMGASGRQTNNYR